MSMRLHQIPDTSKECTNKQLIEQNKEAELVVQQKAVHLPVDQMEMTKLELAKQEEQRCLK